MYVAKKLTAYGFIREFAVLRSTWNSFHDTNNFGNILLRFVCVFLAAYQASHLRQHSFEIDKIEVYQK